MLAKIRKSIFGGTLSDAFEIAKEIPNDKFRVALSIIVLQDIGVANIPLVQKCLLSEYDLEEMITEISISERCRGCCILACCFKMPMLDNKYILEPFPDREESDFRAELMKAGTMYLKGMHKIFWEHIYSNCKFAKNEGLRSAMVCAIDTFRKWKTGSEPLLWVFAILVCKYMNSTMELINSAKAWCVAKYNKCSVRISDDRECSAYFYAETINEELPVVNKSIYTSDTRPSCLTIYNNLCKHTYPIGNIIPAKFTYSELINIASPKKKNFPTLDMFGTFQIPCASTSTNIICWLNDGDAKCRYLLKRFTNKSIAVATAKIDNMLCDLHPYSWCEKSVIIGITGVIDDGRINRQKVYYSISRDLPYGTPIDIAIPNWRLLPIADKVYLLDILRYIFSISGETYVSMENLEPKIHSVRNQVANVSFLSKELVKCLGNKKRFIPEREWLLELQVEPKYYSRYSEVISLL